MNPENNNLPPSINIEFGEPPLVHEFCDFKSQFQNTWIPPQLTEKEALLKELEDAKKELAAARKKLEEKPVSRFKVSHEVVFTPKTSD
jgi:hypothetical protein